VVDEIGIDEVVELFIDASIRASEANKAADEVKAEKDDLAVRLLPYVQDAAPDGKVYEVVRGGKVMGKIRVMDSLSYVLSPDVTYEDMIAHGLMQKREGKYLRWYPKTERTKKTKDELV
jgi:hypothetical protein